MPARPPIRLRCAALALASVCAALTLAPPAAASEIRSDRPSDAPGVRTPPIIQELVVAEPSLSPAVIGLVLAQAVTDKPTGPGGQREPVATAVVTGTEAGSQASISLVPGPERPRGLIPLYASFAALQALDIHSTLTGLHNGAVEQNAVVAPVVSRPAAYVVLKAGVTAGTIFAVDRLARHNRVAAYALMFALNSAYTVVVVHNYRVQR